MTQRDAVLVLVGVVLALGIGGVLLVGSLSSGATGEPRTPRVFINQGAARVQPSRAPDADQPVPPAFRAIVPVERGIATGVREAAGYLLALLAVAAALVLAREQVVGAYRASLGGWRSQARALGTGLAVLALVLSAMFLTSIVFLGALTRGRSPGTGFPAGGPQFFNPSSLQVQVGLQAGFIVLSVIAVLVLLPALIGFAAASWRLGDLVLGIRGIARWGALVPAPIVTLLGVTILYVLAQVPYVGVAVGLAVLAYALGVFVTARLEPHGTSAASAQS